jgi:L-asparaginase / beta-aspartyl-peptidase
MFLLTNSAARAGVPAGHAALLRGAPLLDVLEIALREAESDREERSLGLGGRPNFLGQVELDASLMDGATRRTGSVGALQGFLHPVSVARQVLERLPHEILVGEGAALFGREIGAETGNLLTPESEAEWREWLRREGSIEPASARVWRTVSFGSQRDTAIVLASDGTHLASGTSTCGWPFKYPGRLGDSALIGSGHYADSRAGAAACTHTGEMAIRAGTARAVVLALQRGRSAEEACQEAIEDVRQLRTGLLSDLIVHALDRAGNCCVRSTGIEGGYWWWSRGMNAPEERAAIVM